MTAHLTPVRLYEPDGSLLTVGVVHLGPEDCPNPTRLCVSGLDQPGRVVQRCVLGAVRLLRIELDGGGAVSAEIERVAFDPRHGRILVLRLRPDEACSVARRVPVLTAD